MKTKIETFNQQNLKELRSEFNRALATLAAEYGLTAKLGSGQFDNTTFTVKLEVETVNHRIKVEQNYPQFFKIGTAFRFKTSIFTITKVDPSKPKYKYVAKNQNGTSYLFSHAAVKDGLIKAA